MKVIFGWIADEIRCHLKDSNISEHIKGWNSYNEIKGKFEPIDTSKSNDSDKQFDKIDKFYGDKNKVNDILEGKTLLYRKAHLENNISESGLVKEIKVVFLSALFSVFITEIFDILVPESKEIVSLVLYIILAAVTLIAILINIFCTLEKSKEQFDRYEISVIDKVLENRGSSEKMFLVEFEDGSKSLVIHK